MNICMNCGQRHGGVIPCLDLALHQVAACRAQRDKALADLAIVRNGVALAKAQEARAAQALDAARAQRDRLAGLLKHARSRIDHMLGISALALKTDIDAALAEVEVKP